MASPFSPQDPPLSTPDDPDTLRRMIEQAKADGCRYTLAALRRKLALVESADANRALADIIARRSPDRARSPWVEEI